MAKGLTKEKQRKIIKGRKKIEALINRGIKLNAPKKNINLRSVVSAVKRAIQGSKM